jgi:hypothetical protein
MEKTSVHVHDVQLERNTVAYCSAMMRAISTEVGPCRRPLSRAQVATESNQGTVQYSIPKMRMRDGCTPHVAGGSASAFDPYRSLLPRRPPAPLRPLDRSVGSVLSYRFKARCHLVGFEVHNGQPSRVCFPTSNNAPLGALLSLPYRTTKVRP